MGPSMLNKTWLRAIKGPKFPDSKPGSWEEWWTYDGISDKHRVGGILANTSHSVVFAVDNETWHPVTISEGPLSYRHRHREIHLHYGLHGHFGSEHAVDGYAFPAEVQTFGLNSQLYNNFADALHKAQGIVAGSLLLQLDDLLNPELKKFKEQLDTIKYGAISRKQS